MEGKYQLLRQQLDELGYKQLLVPEAVPLVEKLVADLIQTTESLEKYKKIAKNATEERDHLELGAEPYKCDNAKLVRECNELHQAFRQYREKNEAIQKDLKKGIKNLENQLSDCEKQKVRLKEKVRDLEYASVISKNKRTGAAFRTGKSASTSTLRDNKALQSSSKTDLEGAMSAANQKNAYLMCEINKLKDEKIDLVDKCECYKGQIMSRDREIERLSLLLEGGRPIQAVNSDCCYRDTEGRISTMQDEINILKKEKCNLEICWKEAVAKQHEAMKRALHLANRNRELEKELRDIDHMALAVEADANCSARINAEKVSKLQDKIQDALMQIQSLETEVNQLRREKQEILSDWEGTTVEKKHLQALLETALEEKRLMSDRINQFTIIEDDLNIEIDRLMKYSAEQKKAIAELECRIMSKDLESEDHLPVKKQQSVKINKSLSKTKSRSKSPLSSPSKSKSSPSKASPSMSKAGKKKKGEKRDMSKEEQLIMGQSHSGVINSESVMNESFSDKKVGTEQVCRCCNSASCVERMRMLLDRDLEQRQLQMCLINLDNIRGEKDYYMREYHRLLEQMNNRSGRPDAQFTSDEMRRTEQQSSYSLQRELNQKLNEKDQIILNLQKENKTLAEEKFNLMSRLETIRDRTDADAETVSLKATIKRLEREKELLKDKIEELQKEKDKLRNELKEMFELKSVASTNLNTIRETEERLKAIEKEKEELLQDQRVRRATIASQHDEIGTLKSQLQSAQAELAHQKNLYNQLKNLQEQSDRAISEAQNKIRQLETELAEARDRLGSVHTVREEQGQQVINLKQDINTLKRNLTQLENEKDELLNSLDSKTEMIARLEKDVRQKNGYITELEDNVKDLKQQIGVMADGTSIKEQTLKSVSSENLSLKAELEAALKAKENASIENRRIQEELATCIAEGRKVHQDLEIAKRQIEDLKMQLQHYVAEVKRTEDLISQKETERNEVLDQFRNLSDEAAFLESSNHNLASEATQSKVQLSVALEHATDLEKKLVEQEEVVMAYEKQLSEVTAQVACLEVELKKEKLKNDKLESELASLKSLCGKLDKQNDSMNRKLSEHSEMAFEVERLRRDSESLRDILTKDRNTVEYLEKLLSESRQEAVNVKLLNQDLQNEIQRLKSKTEELQNKLLKCLSEHNRDVDSVFLSPSLETLSRKNEKPTENNKPTRNTIVEVEVAETVTVRNNNPNKKSPECCCCPPTFKSNNRRSHVCYCPFYDVKHVLCPGMTTSGLEDCGCGSNVKCCKQPFLKQCVTYSLSPNDRTSSPQHNVRK